MRLTNIKKHFNNKEILNIESVDFEFGKIYSILGENGSGKSTFGKILSGLEKTDDNINIKKVIIEQNENIKNFKIGYLSQKPYVFDMSLENNIKINANRIKNADAKAKILIEDFNLTYLHKKNAKSFSGGEQQKLSLARFMMKEYNICIFDEVTSAMDTNSILNAEKNIIKYLNSEYDDSLNKKNKNEKIIIMITHNIEQAKRISDKIYYLKNKTIVSDI